MTASIADGPAQLLHMLGHLCSGHGETRRGVVMLLIAARLSPGDAGIWRTLAYAFLADGAPERTIAVVGHLRLIGEPDHPALDLLMSRALWACGRHTEARRSFREFLSHHVQS
jgi:type III secretion protein Y